MENKRGRPKTNKPVKSEVLQIRLTEQEKDYIFENAYLADSMADLILTAVKEYVTRKKREEDIEHELIRRDLGLDF